MAKQSIAKQTMVKQMMSKVMATKRMASNQTTMIKQLFQNRDGRTTREQTWMMLNQLEESKKNWNAFGNIGDQPSDLGIHDLWTDCDMEGWIWKIAYRFIILAVVHCWLLGLRDRFTVHQFAPTLACHFFVHLVWFSNWNDFIFSKLIKKNFQLSIVVGAMIRAYLFIEPSYISCFSSWVLW